MKKVSFKQISGFVAAGGMATLFHWAAMSGLVLLGMDPVAATFSGSVVGAVTNYWLQRTLAFPTARPHIEAVWRYVLSCSFASLLNVLIFFVLNRLFEIPVAPAQLLTTVAVAAFNYVVYQRLVFREQTS
ncbi:GtrA family protein [Marinobacter metalliresistant]|uniref:GtrA family protein n=1 Tax=Marinobacter metalliresistant TaxID=2961995 RepID=A0ABZ2W3C3_9GAMM